MNSESTTKAFLTNKEAANFLRTSVVTLWRLRRKNELSFHRIGSKLLYRISDLEDYIQQHKRNCEVNYEQK